MYKNYNKLILTFQYNCLNYFISPGKWRSERAENEKEKILALYLAVFVVGKPIKYSELVNKGMTKDEMCEYLCNECNLLGAYQKDIGNK